MVRFKNQIFETESTKPKLTQQYHGHIHFSHFQEPGIYFRFYLPKKNYKIWCTFTLILLSLTRVQTIVKQSQNCLRVFFSTKSYLSNALLRQTIALTRREIQVTDYKKSNEFHLTLINRPKIFYMNIWKEKSRVRHFKRPFVMVQ